MTTPETRQWALEFGTAWSVPEEIDKLVSEGKLFDQSWHNDTLPSFSRQVGTTLFTLYVDHVTPDEREFPQNNRFAVDLVACDAEGNPIENADYTRPYLYDGDSLADCLSTLMLAIHNANMSQSMR
jgi:hypothetical protein